MKPANWSELTDAQRKSEAVRLLNSARGSYILGQALALGIEKLKSVKPAHMQEMPDIQDMEMLQELFLPFITSAQMREVMVKSGM